MREMQGLRGPAVITMMPRRIGDSIVIVALAGVPWVARRDASADKVFSAWLGACWRSACSQWTAAWKRGITAMGTVLVTKIATCSMARVIPDYHDCVKCHYGGTQARQGRSCCCTEYACFLQGIQRRETRDERRETRDERDERPETRDQRPERPETRDQRPETRHQTPDTRHQTRDQGNRRGIHFSVFTATSAIERLQHATRRQRDNATTR
jgi:hypothetical protein